MNMDFDINDTVIYNDERFLTAHAPFEQYINKVLKLYYLESLHELYLKIYWATWEILDDKLFLTDIQGRINVSIPQKLKHKKVLNNLVLSGNTLDLNSYMYGKDIEFADWYTGNIILFKKEMQTVKDIEKYNDQLLILEIADGILTKTSSSNMEELRKDYYRKFKN
jgi:hypothetical protein